MKFVALAALIAVAQAEVGDECASTADCEDTECCGTAVPDTANGSTAEGNI